MFIGDPSLLFQKERQVVGGGYEIDTPATLDILLDSFRGGRRGRRAEGTPVFKRRDGIKRICRVGGDKVHDTGWGGRPISVAIRQRRAFTSRPTHSSETQESIRGAMTGIRYLNRQPFLMDGFFAKGPDGADIWIRTDRIVSRDDTPLCEVPSEVGRYLPIFLLNRARGIAIAFRSHEELGDLERMTEMGVQVKSPVEKLVGIETRDECVGSRLETPKRDRVRKVARKMAVGIERSSSEFGDGKVGDTTAQSESDERAWRKAGKDEIASGRTGEQVCAQQVHAVNAWENYITPNLNALVGVLKRSIHVMIRLVACRPGYDLHIP